jgi:hypothetical protein
MVDNNNDNGNNSNQQRLVNNGRGPWSMAERLKGRCGLSMARQQKSIGSLLSSTSGIYEPKVKKNDEDSEGIDRSCTQEFVLSLA